MKKYLEKYKELMEHPKGKAIVFFSFYALFFLFIIIFIKTTGKKDALLQEYEKGDTSYFHTMELFNGNFYYDYKITVDDVLYDYYGKMLYEKESFKYNNQDYLKNDSIYYLNGEVVENPFLFREFVELDHIHSILNNAFYVSKTEYEDGTLEYHFLISSNTLNQILYQEDTDYDDIPNDIIIKTNSSGVITSINFHMNSFCDYRDTCNHLDILLTYELYGEVKDIKGIPISDNT